MKGVRGAEKGQKSGPSKQRRDLARFVKLGLLFLALLAIIIVLFNTLYVKLVFEDKRIYRKEQAFHEYMESLDEPVLDVAFFGDSIAEYGVDPSMIPRSFDFALFGEQVPTTYIKLQHLYEVDGIDIRTVVIELDPHTVAETPRGYQFLRRDIYFYADDSQFKDVQEITGDSYIEYFFSSRFPFIGKGEDMRYLLMSPDLTQINRGATVITGNFSRSGGKVANAEQMVSAHFSGMDILGEQSLEYLAKIVELAHEHGSTVVFLTYPPTPEYAAVMEAHGLDREAILASILASIPGEPCKDYFWLDYWHLFERRPGYANIFADARHLNYAGARLLTARLKEDLGRLPEASRCELPTKRFDQEGIREYPEQ